MKGDTSPSVPAAQLKQQVKSLIKRDKLQVKKIRGAEAKLQVDAENDKKPRNSGETEKLQAILSYYSENGSFPFSDFASFQGFVMNSLQAEVSASEMMNAIEDLKQNYDKISNVNCSLNDSPDVTELPGMILGNVTENANDSPEVDSGVQLNRSLDNILNFIRQQGLENMQLEDIEAGFQKANAIRDSLEELKKQKINLEDPP